MEWGNDILGLIDGLIASYLGEKCRLLPVLRPIFGKNDMFSVLGPQFLVFSSIQLLIASRLPPIAFRLYNIVFLLQPLLCCFAAQVAVFTLLPACNGPFQRSNEVKPACNTTFLPNNAPFRHCNDHCNPTPHHCNPTMTYCYATMDHCNLQLQLLHWLNDQSRYKLIIATYFWSVAALQL